VRRVRQGQKLRSIGGALEHRSRAPLSAPSELRSYGYVCALRRGGACRFARQTGIRRRAAGAHRCWRVAAQFKSILRGLAATHVRVWATPDTTDRSARIWLAIGTRYARSALAAICQLTRMWSVEVFFTNPAYILAPVASY
jgi:hypothetical protein